MTDPHRLPEDAVRAVLAARLGVLPPGHRIQLSEVGRLLWRGWSIDHNGWPNPGGSFLVTPDARLWAISSNAGIHDSCLAEQLLELAFSEGLGGRLDHEKFLDRLSSMTSRREAEIRTFVSDVRGGNLRMQHDRKLP